MRLVNRRIIVRLATVGLLAAGTLAVASPAHAQAPCVDPLDFYFFGANQYGAGWAQNSYLWASDSQHCKDNGDHYVAVTGYGTQYMGRKDFTIARPQ
jgi:hypothetical protein